VRRRQRGIYLRTALAAHIMHHEADHCCQSLLVPQKQETAPAVFDPKMTSVTTDPAIDEAWQNLDAFSRLTADDLSRLKVQLYNYQIASAWKDRNSKFRTVTNLPKLNRSFATRLRRYEGFACGFATPCERKRPSCRTRSRPATLEFRFSLLATSTASAIRHLNSRIPDSRSIARRYLAVIACPSDHF
jgi:hypothetical protein